VAVITGASGMRGIGRAIALRFVKDGLDVVLVDIERLPSRIPEAELAAGWRGIESVKDEVQALGGRALCVHADISDATQVADLCDQAVREFGRIDVLVNSARAGIGRDRVPVVDLELSEWERVMHVNATGTFLLCQAVARHLIARKSPGHIVNLSSLSSKRAMPNHAAYASSKFAVNGFTQLLARELGPHGIRVNAICPGWIDTGRFSLAEKMAAEKAGKSVAEVARAALEEQASRNVLGRIADADDVAGVAAFLISRDAQHITGQAINVCGGEVFH
jgi:NAD(P)-dependent dehydrogenase (short-subunit alcohol dehydrogenase family)